LTEEGAGRRWVQRGRWERQRRSEGALAIQDLRARCFCTARLNLGLLGGGGCRRWGAGAAIWNARADGPPQEKGVRSAGRADGLLETLIGLRELVRARLEKAEDEAGTKGCVDVSV
jgi:hypothetical protein